MNSEIVKSKMVVLTEIDKIDLTDVDVVMGWLL
jgi:hypothetical protein